MRTGWPPSKHLLTQLVACCLLLVVAPARAADKLIWHTNPDRVEADITAWSLSRLLQTIASTTGWQIFVEPGTEHVVSTKFTDRPIGPGLRLLLGDLSFALLPQQAGPPKLFVFRTTIGQANQPIEPAPKRNEEDTASPIANQLILKVRPGTDIEKLAREVGGKVIGAVEALNIYQLEFPDQAARDRARDLLSRAEEVESVEFNYNLNRVPRADPLSLHYSRHLNLRPKAVGKSDQIVIGLIDTAVQRQGSQLDDFLLPSLAVAGPSAPGEDMPSHGTAMSETILRGLSAMSLDSETRVRILPVDVYGSRNQTSTFDVANGIYAAINQGATLINLSLGTDGDTPFLRNLIQSAHEQGVVFFGAAGNEPLTTPNFPAAYPEVVAVTAGDRQGNISPYANRGDFIDVIAPGTTHVVYNNQSFLVVGTSAATAYATGMAAGLAERTGNVLPAVEAEIRHLLAAP